MKVFIFLIYFFLVKILIELCYFCDYFSRVLESAKMYLQFYINENGDKVYTTKVRHFCKSQWLFCHKITCIQHSFILELKQLEAQFCSYLFVMADLYLNR